MTAFAVELKRTLPAPRARVYRAWLEPDTLLRWFSPDGFPVTHAEVDERVGGVHRTEMLDPDGNRHAFESVIEELVSDARIALAARTPRRASTRGSRSASATASVRARVSSPCGRSASRSPRPSTRSR